MRSIEIQNLILMKLFELTDGHSLVWVSTQKIGEESGFTDYLKIEECTQALYDKRLIDTATSGAHPERGRLLSLTPKGVEYVEQMIEASKKKKLGF